MKLLRIVCFCIALSIAMPSFVFAHGGTYRGPGDTVPPGGGGGGGGGPTTPGPTGPTSPGPAGPSSPGPAGPGSPGGGAPIGGGPSKPLSGGGGGPTVDLTAWTFWWEFNKDPYLSLKRKIYDSAPGTGSDGWFLGMGAKKNSRDVMRPTSDEIKTKIIPALLNSLETESNNDIITGCMMSLAKIGNQKGNKNFGEKLIPFLGDKNQEISETAAVALGILGDTKYLGVLEALIRDSKEGCDLVGRSEVPYRTRTFAVYALGLIANKVQDSDVSNYVSTNLREILSSDNSSYKDIKVASIVSMSLLELSSEIRDEQVRFLLEYFKDTNNNHLVRAHIPEALCFTVGDLDEDSNLYKEDIVKVLIESLNNDKREVEQSCVLALGLLGDSDDNPLDLKIRKALYSIPSITADQQTRNFSYIALGHMGSNVGRGENRTHSVKDIQKYLIKALVKGKSNVKPWAAISLGVMVNGLREANVDIPIDISRGLLNEFLSENQPSRLGAYSVALGLMGDIEGGQDILNKLKKIRDEEARGYLCVGLGMLKNRKAIEDIRKIVLASKYRPELLQQAAIGLGLMGDYELVSELISMLEESKSLASQASVVLALSFIGDKRSIDPLISLLQNKGVSDRARGFAAASLGMVADKSILPWNSDLSCDLNYRASTVTLNDTGGTGILNIL